MSNSRVFISVLLVCTLVANLPARVIAQSSSKPAQANASLRIVVVSGEDAVNIIQQKTAVAPLVEVRDRNNQPVAGAIVTFSIQGGGNASFAGASTLTATTNALGQATAVSLTPTGAGAVQINVAAAFQGQTATAAITQTNFATAAQAAAAGSSASTGSSAGAGGGGGGGGIGTGTITTLGVVGAAAAGGLYVFKEKEASEFEPLSPDISGFAMSPTVGVASITRMSVTYSAATGGANWRALDVDFGDGAVASLLDTFQSHVYARPGNYTATMTATNEGGKSDTAQTPVEIRSLTGRWSISSGAGTFTLSQDAAALTGSLQLSTGQVCGNIAGIAKDTQRHVTLSGSCPGGNLSFSGDLTTPDQISGNLVIGTSNTSVQLARQ